MSERSSNNTAPSVNRPVEDTQSGTGSEALTLLDIWPWSDDPSQEQIDFVKSKLSTTAQTSLLVLGRRISNAGSIRDLDDIRKQVDSLFRSEAARLSRPARKAAEATTQSQQETAPASSATPSTNNNPTQDGTVGPDDGTHQHSE